MSQQHPDHSGDPITIMTVDPDLDAEIVVTSMAQAPSGKLADRHSAYFDNISPPIQWSEVPEAACWAIIVEDPDAPQDHPFIHWMIWNIEGSLTTIPEGLPNIDYLTTPQGAVQGRNDMGGYGWFGPRPPAGHGLHHYYIQVFALSQTIEMAPETSLSELRNALKARTLAKGEMVVTYEAPEPQ